MLLGAVLHLTLTLGREGIVDLKVQTHAGKSLRLHRSAVLLVAVGSIPRQPMIGGQFDAVPRSRKLIERFFPAESKSVFPVTRIVDRHMPVNGVTVSHRGATERR